MENAFLTVRGALDRGDKTELLCKKIWLDRVIRDLPGTAWAWLAADGLFLVKAALASKTT
jgi:hypothetical protein